MIKSENLNPFLIDIFGLPHVSLSNRSYLPTSSGIYFCCSNEVIVYIGSTSSVLGFRGRWNKESHHVYKKFANCENPVIHYLEVEEKSVADTELIRLCEKYLIRVWQPRFNGKRLTEAHIDELHPCWTTLLTDGIRVEDSPYVCSLSEEGVSRVDEDAFYVDF